MVSRSSSSPLCAWRLLFRCASVYSQTVNSSEDGIVALQRKLLKWVQQNYCAMTIDSPFRKLELLTKKLRCAVHCSIFPRMTTPYVSSDFSLNPSKIGNQKLSFITGITFELMCPHTNLFNGSHYIFEETNK